MRLEAQQQHEIRSAIDRLGFPSGAPHLSSLRDGLHLLCEQRSKGVTGNSTGKQPVCGVLVILRPPNPLKRATASSRPMKWV